MQTMTVPRLSREEFAHTLAFFEELGLLGPSETREVLSLFDPDFLFSESLRQAESVHVHVKVADVASLPHDRIVARGVTAESETPGYVKYPFPGGINMIFSSIDISEDDLLPGSAPAMPVMDHKGIDLRTETPEVRAVFDAVPSIAAAQGWRHVGQGGDGTPVYCCHTEVEEKHWVYPATGQSAHSRPIEVAFGELKIHDSKMGCDLRPIDPAHPRAAEARAALSACSAAHTGGEGGTASGSSYYEPADLARFGEVGDYAKPLMDRFWSYFNATFAEGALTRREKLLIGLAIAISRQDPYCIDSFTRQCLDAGCTPDQVHEAMHAAAAMASGTELVHGVIMQNVMRGRGAI